MSVGHFEALFQHLIWDDRPATTQLAPLIGDASIRRPCFYRLHLVCHATTRCWETVITSRSAVVAVVGDRHDSCVSYNRHDRLMRLLTVHRVQRNQPWAKNSRFSEAWSSGKKTQNIQPEQIDIISFSLYLKESCASKLKEGGGEGCVRKWKHKQKV